MKVNDVLAGVPIDAPELPDAANPFRHTELLVGAQVTRILVDVLAGSVGVLFELRQAPHLNANTGLLRVHGVAQQNWICTSAANEFTAWSITGATVHQRPAEFQISAQCLPAGALRIVGTSADFTLLDAAAASTAPPDDQADGRGLLRFGVADENTPCAVVGIARSVQADSARSDESEFGAA
ncbi:hypothetical protein [Microbacterium sp. W4I20]|jgi:hypothetical protein|uniref:hypothetical protein n=1 Tax=Microbacterium sp. W4I20 TaxID=3042262 RepID=UPI00277EA06C|nr:hypothetical protein [Microbacterium sp. W4I20]MDQ0726548.1 hypothetical protein [Microbacterium sp. W4I20]